MSQDKDRLRELLFDTHNTDDRMTLKMVLWMTVFHTLKNTHTLS